MELMLLAESLLILQNEILCNMCPPLNLLSRNLRRCTCLLNIYPGKLNRVLNRS